MKKGISLIVLVITIIVIIILAGAVILSLANNNPIATAKSAVLKQGVADVMEQLAIAKVMAQKPDISTEEIKSYYNKVRDIITKGNLPIKLDDNGQLLLDISKGATPEEIAIVEEVLGIKENGGGSDTNPIYTETAQYRDANGDIAVIPKGFKILEGLDIIDNGLVISDAQVNGNEFVWVPVEDFSKFKRTSTYDGTITPPTLGDKEGEGDGTTTGTEAEKMYESVKRNKGFYIGRYETGISDKQTPDIINSGKAQDGSFPPIVKAGYAVWNHIGWGGSSSDTASDGYKGNDRADGLVKVSRSLYPDTTLYPELATNASGVVSTLTYGVQWDAALQFISQKDSTYATNSSGKGWYSDVSDSTTACLTGYHEINNIYDMAGNVFEYTMEASTSNRIYRGGAMFTDGAAWPASKRGEGTPGGGHKNYGFRIALYVK